MSPVLQRRRADQQQATASAAGPPVFNISLGHDFANLLRPPAAAAAPPLPPPNYALPSTTLLPPTHLPGPDMPLIEFCARYRLSHSILQKFHDNGYTDSRMLRFVQIEELREMKFMLGEQAALKDAVELWSVPKQF